MRVIWCRIATHLRILGCRKPADQTRVTSGMATGCESIRPVHKIQAYLTSKCLLMIREMRLVSFEKLGNIAVSDTISNLVIQRAYFLLSC